LDSHPISGKIAPNTFCVILAIFPSSRMQFNRSLIEPSSMTIKPLCLSLVVLALSACAVPDSIKAMGDRMNIPLGFGKKDAPPNEKPARIGEVIRSSFDGISDDLLTAGLGKKGLEASAVPAFADNKKPTAGELRKRAIYLNYRALIDTSPNGGYGVLFGPNVSPQGQAGEGEGKIAGTEYLTLLDDGSGQKNVSILVQIPANFNQDKACIVAAPSSGSRGVYGAIGTVGEWGLKKACAMVYTDKGTGTGVHDLANNLVVNLQGEVMEAGPSLKNAQFRTDILAARRSAFSKDNPGRMAFKHAHSQQNPEKDWGRDVLSSIRFAFWAINEEYVKNNAQGFKPVKFQPDNTLVIAASVSNGGGASLRAAELDTEGLIDGVAVSEPQVQTRVPSRISVEQGNQKMPSIGRSLYDYTTLANLYQPCAAHAAALKSAPGFSFVVAARAQNRCAGLQASGLLKAQSFEAQAEESLGILLASGWLPESNLLHASHYAFATSSVAITYAMSYARASVLDHLCGFSFASAEAQGGKPVATPPEFLAGMFANGSGLSPTGGIVTINQNAEGGPMLDLASTSTSSKKPDFNLDGALCLRSLIAAEDIPSPQGQSAIRARQSADLKRGIEEVMASANLRGKPAIIVHGRNDALVPVNHSSRPYFALNQATEGANSKLRYIEVTNAHHFDAFNASPALPGLDIKFIPLQRYYLQALDSLYRHLAANADLPDSQVVRTNPRSGEPGKAQALSLENVPAFPLQSAAANRIVFNNNTLLIAE
jgi:hydroxybutyrate-dimer hydrolase